MNISKKTVKITSLLALLFFLSGCHLFSEAQKQLNLYCPGLKVDINGVSWSGNGSRNVYVLSYDRGFQKTVRAYFDKKENGFTQEKNGDFYDIKIDDNQVIDRDDHILVKTIVKSKGTEEVIFNETTRKIVIIEE